MVPTPALSPRSWGFGMTRTPALGFCLLTCKVGAIGASAAALGFLG